MPLRLKSNRLTHVLGRQSVKQSHPKSPVTSCRTATNSLEPLTVCGQPLYCDPAVLHATRFYSYSSPLRNLWTASGKMLASIYSLGSHYRVIGPPFLPQFHKVSGTHFYNWVTGWGRGRGGGWLSWQYMNHRSLQ